MKYLAIFQLETMKSANAFKTKAEAEKYIKDCASLAGFEANAGEKADTYTFTNKTATADPARQTAINKLTARVESVDVNTKYQLSYNKNGQNVETKLYDTREEVVSQAKKIIDENEYNATKEENMMGAWSIDDLDKSLKVDLKAKLVLVSSKDEHVVSSYDAIDMKEFCRNFDQSLAKFNVTVAANNASELKDARKKGIINLCVGLGVAALGGILSLVSYNNAKPGEKYTIYTGFIAVGIIAAVCGIYYIINPKAGTKKK